jgi:hypothetical protein
MLDGTVELQGHRQPFARNGSQISIVKEKARWI